MNDHGSYGHGSYEKRTAPIRNAILLLALFAFFAFMAPSAWATSFYPQPFPESVQTAPVIVRGKIGMTYSDWSKDNAGGKRIYTFYEMQPTEVLKGNASASSSLTLRELGGEKDGIGLNVPGVSQFERGEDTLVFLKERNTDGWYDVQGMMMGKYNIQKDADGAEYLTGMGLNNFNNVSHNPHGNFQGMADSTLPKKWSLNALRQLIQSQADARSRETESRDTGSRDAESRKEPRQNLSSLTSLPTPISPTPRQEPSPLTSAQLPPPETHENSNASPSKLWLFLLPLIGILALWRYRKNQ